MDQTNERPRGVEFDDDLLADVPLDRERADRVVGGNVVGRKAEAAPKKVR